MHYPIHTGLSSGEVGNKNYNDYLLAVLLPTLHKLVHKKFSNRWLK